MNVEEVQRRLWEQSQHHKQHRESGSPLFPVNPYENRIRNLMDLMHHPQWITQACDRVISRSRGKAAGVDKVTVVQFEKKLATELETLRQELKRGTYRPQPLRRVMIPKANGKMRALGIPCLRDKIVQEAMRMALEPIFEVEFHNDSYGFRPNRSTHNAIFRCQQLMQRHFTWVIEGDVKACFDEISHKAILQALREKVMDSKFLKLTRLFLKTGVEIDGIVHPNEKGVPQGGTISPLLANVVLNKLDWFLHEKSTQGLAGRRAAYHQQPNLRFVRYADDWCVLTTRVSKRYAQMLREQIRKFLADKFNLQLSEEKTKVTHVRDGFNFLGFHLKVGIGQSGVPVPKIRVPQKAIINAQRRLAQAMRYRPQQESVAIRIIRGSKVVRGWAHYYKIAHNFSNVSYKLDNHAYWTAAKAICRKNDLTTGQCLRKYTFGNAIGVTEKCTLAKFSDVKMSLDYRGPLPYEPGKDRYQGNLEAEVEFRIHEATRPGSMDLKYEVLIRDDYRCQKCKKIVSDTTSHADHIKPVKQFASFAQAHELNNIQTLCIECHKAKTYAKYN